MVQVSAMAAQPPITLRAMGAPLGDPEIVALVQPVASSPTTAATIVHQMRRGSPFVKHF
ncbi:hypothetical protein ACF3NS_05070 [Arsenicicoccus cauae]|uniref:Uncharacterized protein n=1 Tax=Arsenicicoccus cauae TaxID=2663847 RepID=A0A6I3IH62_9MICO|nr:hypothetical protein [Arsenicicoccus cauae]MTB71045.1 hypothetical protein [Arsenicicoccus cauae]